MSDFFLDLMKESREREHEEAFRRGVEDGKKATIVDAIVREAGELATIFVPGETTEHKSYGAGWKAGREQAASATGESSQPGTDTVSDTSGSAGSSDSSGVCSPSNGFDRRGSVRFFTFILFFAVTWVGSCILEVALPQYFARGATEPSWFLQFLLCYVLVALVIAYLLARGIVSWLSRL